MVKHLNAEMRHADVIDFGKAKHAVKAYFREVLPDDIQLVADVPDGFFDKRKKSRLDER